RIRISRRSKRKPRQRQVWNRPHRLLRRRPPKAHRPPKESADVSLKTFNFQLPPLLVELKEQFWGALSGRTCYRLPSRGRCPRLRWGSPAGCVAATCNVTVKG